MTLDDLLGLGLVLAVESQLRIAGLAFGPGEVCLAFWIGLVLVRRGIGPGRPTRAFSAMMTFWTFFISAQCIGTVWGDLTAVEYDRGLFLHDVLAYMLLAPLSRLIV